MMAAWASSGALLLVLLTGASYSYPAKKGFDPSSSSGSSYGANPASAGSSYEVPSSGFAVSGSGAVSGTAPKPARSRASQPSARREPAGVSYSAHSVGSAQPSSFQPASTRDIDWLVAPPGPFSGEETSPRPSARRIDSSNPAPELLGPSNVSPPIFPPEYQGGELLHEENSFEFGYYDSETEDQGFQPPPPGVHAVTAESSSELAPSSPGSAWIPYPDPEPYPYPYPYDYMFLTGQYPPGTVTHLSSSFEQGSDYWHDTHYIRDYFPAYADTQVVENFPTEFAAPPSVKQPSQPVKRPSQPVKQPSQPVKQSSRAPGLPGGYSMRKA